jgi:DNA polymerase/3'-5' exonuclease PolX
MSSGKRFHPEYAGMVAQGVLHHLGDCCERMEIAGSLRRKTEDVGDIEIVCVPKGVIPQMSIPVYGFGETKNKRKMPREVFPLYDEIRKLDWLVPRKDKAGQTRLGPRYMALRDACTGVPIDLFCVLPPAQWGAIMTIRTGPADFSHMLMSVSRRKGFQCEDGQLFRVNKREGTKRLVDTPEESDFFKAINVAWIEPENRL